MPSNNRTPSAADEHLASRETPDPARVEPPNALASELISFAKLAPWVCLAAVLTTTLRTLVFDSDPSLYATSMYLIAFNRGLGALALVFGLLSFWRLHTGANLRSPQVELWLIGVLLVCIAILNAGLLIETGSQLHVIEAIMTMVGTAFVFPRWIGVFVVTVPQLLVVTWLAQQSSWAPGWPPALFMTWGGTLVAILGYYARQLYAARHRAQLAERTRTIKSLQTEAIERAVLQERALNDRHLSTLGRLAGGIAHDLNNILVPILGNASMLEEAAQTSTQKQQAKEVMIAAGRARNLTQQLGFFSTRDNMVQETIELNRALAELAPIVWRALPQGVDIIICDNPEPVYLTLNRMTLQDLITNLLLDAGNATLSGGSVSLEVLPTVDLPAEFTVHTDQPYCAVSIRDGAETLDQHEKSQLLDSSRLEIPHRKRGLGLRSAGESAELLGGALTLGEANKQGNQFLLYLPRRAEGLSDHGRVDQRVSSAVATEVLVVDDEPAVRNVSVQLLQRAGFVVRSCHSGEAALQEIAGHLPDVIVMDLRMPGMGGRLAAEAIREQYAKLPIIFCTGFAGDAQGWLEHMSYCALLLKPYDTRELIDTVKRLLQPQIAED